MAEDDSLTESSSDPNPCPICLSAVTEDSYLDKCFHKFCYSCIRRWMDVVASKQSSAPSLTLKCPFCKTDNFSIIYGYDGTSFQQHYIGKCWRNRYRCCFIWRLYHVYLSLSFLLRFSIGKISKYFIIPFPSEFFSGAHRYRLKCYYTKPGNIACKLHVLRHWKFRKYVQQNHFLPDWLRREIQALIQEEDVDIIMHHILGVIDSLRRDWLNNPKNSAEMVQKEFSVSVSEAVRPFIRGRTERFVDELELFLASGLTIEAFDKVYNDHLGWEINEISDKEHDEPIEHISAVPCLYIFDDDSDVN